MKGAGYGQVQRGFWTHRRYQDGLTLEDKALVSYLLTGPHSNGIGAYRLPLAYAADDLRTSVQTVRKLLANCIRTGFCRYCEQSSVIWIPKAMRYQDVRNGNVAIGRAKEFGAIPKNCAYLPEIAGDLLENGNHWSEQFANSLETISKQAATPEPEPEPERESSNELSCPSPQASNGRKRKPPLDVEFERFWDAYPLKEKKTDARRAWIKHRLDPRADELIADVIRRKAEHRRWLDGFVPHPTTYINGARWEDEITPITTAPTGNGQSPPRKPSAVERVLARNAAAERERAARTIDGISQEPPNDTTH